jgi:AcrR family transcriptional regulator
VSGAAREALVAAAADVIAGRGYRGMSAVAVTFRAGVPLESFHEHFESLDACFLAALEATLRRVAASDASVDGRDSTRSDRLTAALRALLEFLEHEPATKSAQHVDDAARQQAFERFTRALSMLGTVLSERPEVPNGSASASRPGALIDMHGSWPTAVKARRGKAR